MSLDDLRPVITREAIMKQPAQTLAVTAASAALAIMGAAAAAAQQHHPAPATSAPSYADLQARAVKALSEQQIADLGAGRGMGMALPAELNGYPGPIHVLELSDRLSLTDAQRRRIQALYEAMKVEAVPLGERLIAQEADLERLFAARTLTPAALNSATEAVGATQGALQAAHLKYHLLTADALTPDQVRAYAVLRGYTGGHGGDAHGSGDGQRR